MPVNPPGPFGQGPGPQQISVPAGDMVKNIHVHINEHLNYFSLKMGFPFEKIVYCILGFETAA